MVKVNEIQFIPENPGCYLFKDSSGSVLYVGKAKNLRKRVGSYFLKKELDNKTAMLVSLIKEVDFFITGSEAEAFLLENNLIKKYYPKYNLDLKDSRRYAYILIHDDSLPWIEVARIREGKGEYYGPFVSGAIRKIIMDVLTRNFRVLTRKALASLKKTIDPVAYNERVRQARQILKGNVDELIADLKKKMQEHSNKRNYEYAISLRNQISALETLKEKQNIEMTRAVDAHIINYAVIGNEVFLLVFSIRRGVLEEKQDFSFEYYSDFLEDFLSQYYDSAPIPQEIILPVEVNSSFSEYLSKKSGRKVSIIVPERGNKKELLELVSANIKTTFFAGGERMLALQKIISLKEMPKIIECFDISHLGGTNSVASMVCFKNGLPDKSSYRKFKLRIASEGNDYAAMKEVVQRRYSGSLSKSMKRPDLIVMDGGQIQLNAALSVLKELRINIPVIALAKRFEEIYIPDQENPLVVDRKNKGLQLLQAIRDEAHRFAVSYQRKLRGKGLFSDKTDN